MINRNEFQKIAEQFRGGRMSLRDLMSAVFSDGVNNKPDAGFDCEKLNLRLPVRPSNSHKGDFGRVLLIGGSANMPGAIALSGMAALRTGAGLASIVTPVDAKRVVASFSPCLMTTGVASRSGLFSIRTLDELRTRSQWADVVAIGPGMGLSKSCAAIVAALYRELPQTMVIDADGLNNLAKSKLDLTQHVGERVLTPHPGEFERLTGQTFHMRREMEEHAVEFARRNRCVIVLKGHHTLVSDGIRINRNETGNEGMATAGSGDVLTGVIASMVGQKMECFDSAQVGCYLHGLAADIYAEQNLPASLIATDLIDFLPDAMMKLADGKTDR